MPTEIRAAVMCAPHEPLEIETLTLADPRPHEVRIALQATGLCHSDLNYIEGRAGHYLPVVLGHEGMGTVVEVGSEVTHVQVRDTVIPYLVPDCGECEWCRSGLTNHCMTFNRDFLNLGYSPFTRADGEPVAMLLGTGTFAEQTVVNGSQVVKVNAAADPSLACCLACAVTTGIGAVLSTADVRPGSSVAIFGMGGVGLGVLQGARMAGASTIIAIDTNSDKEPVSRKLGATHFLDARSPSLVDEIRELTKGGAGYSFDCVGRVDVYHAAISCLNHGLGGVMVGLGVVPPSEKICLTTVDLNGATLKRSFMGDAKRADVARNVDWFVEGKIDLEDVVSHRVALDEINEGFRLMHTGEAVRVVVVF